MRQLLLLCALLAPLETRAQTTTATKADFHAAPGGVLLANVHAGAAVTPGTARGAWTAVTLEGYLHESVIAGKRDSFPISARVDGAVLRASGDRAGKPVAALRKGMGLHRVSRRGEWVRVRRLGWVRSASLARASSPAAARRETPQPVRTPAAPAARAPAAQAAQPPVDTGARAAEPVAQSALAIERRAEMHRSPDEGGAVATLDSGARVTPLARDRGWVRVQVEGWVRETELVPASGTVLTAISAADLRAEPEKFKGELVRWRVQKIALQTADPLHRGMAPDEPYLLARGPDTERALLYLALPPSLLDQARRVEPLATIVVTARVRAGRSEPSGVPLLEVQSIARP